MLDYLGTIFTGYNILMMNIGMTFGIIIGALPGLSVLLAVTILLPFTFGMDSLSGMYLLLGAYCGGTYGGSITAILINTPGTPNAVCTTLDGYPLAKQGRGGDALETALVGSTVGGMISCLALLFAAPAIASYALSFGAPEYFALCVFGMVIVVCLIGNSLRKGGIMACLGLLLSTVGIDSISATSRFMFGSPHLLAGIQTVSLMLGVFAVAEILNTCALENNASVANALDFQKAEVGFFSLLKYWKSMLRSAIIGIFIGAVPGTGGAIAAFISYSLAKKGSKEADRFGKGSLEGIIAPETANNGVTGATLIPLLTLGIPGDACMAVLYGALIMQGITPGPSLFTQDQYWVYCIMIGLFAINFFMLLQGHYLCKAFAHVTKVPFSILFPCIMMFCLLGSYAIRNITFDVYTMLLFGIVGFFLKRCDYSIPPLAIGLVLGQLTENNLRRSLSLSGGSLSIFVERPIALVVLCISAVILIVKIARSRKKTPIAETVLPADD